MIDHKNQRWQNSLLRLLLHVANKTDSLQSAISNLLKKPASG